MDKKFQAMEYVCEQLVELEWQVFTGFVSGSDIEKRIKDLAERAKKALEVNNSDAKDSDA